MNYNKVKAIAHNLKLLAQSLEDAIKEDVDSYNKGRDPQRYDGGYGVWDEEVPD
jgi:hypothetical protein|tara:strand:- start:1147 stop:1308 length:162 start_codon:yes stop_codon:yes gene_type:complete